MDLEKLATYKAPNDSWIILKNKKIIDSLEKGTHTYVEISNLLSCRITEIIKVSRKQWN